MREQLKTDIQLMLEKENALTDRIKSKLTIILDKYEITKRETELAIYEEDETEKYLRMFLVNKKISGRTERTLKHYKNTLVSFFNDVKKNPTDIKADDIKLYLALKDVNSKITKASLKNIVRVLSSFYGWMIKEEYIIKNPMNKVDEIKLPKIKKHAFSEMDIEIMRNNLITLRDKALFEILLSTWCRVSEVEGMDISKLRNDGSIEVLGKGQKTRIVYLNAKAQVAVDEYLKTRKDDEEALFVSLDYPHHRLGQSQIEAIIRKLGKKSGVEKAHPHRFRRTGATFALRRGMPIEQVSKLLGHESIDTTQIYLDITEAEISQAHKKYV